MRATSKRRQCSTSYSLDQKLEKYHEREESMSVQIEQLKEENIRSKRSLVGMHRVLRARRHIEAQLRSSLMLSATAMRL